MVSDLTNIAAVVERARASFEASLAASGVSPEDHDAAVLAEAQRQREEQRRQLDLETRRAVLERVGGRITDEARAALLRGAAEPTPAMRAVEEWLSSPRWPALVLVGGVGTGKTVAGISALFRVPGDLVHARELARRHDPWGEDRQGGVRPLDLRHRLLVLDDLGTERLEDPRFIPALEDLVDARQGGGLRTLITTNLRKEELRSRYGHRVADRLNAIASGVRLTSDSMRRRSA